MKYLIIIFIFLLVNLFSDIVYSTYNEKAIKNIKPINEKEIHKYGSLIITDKDFINTNFKLEDVIIFIRKVFPNNKFSDEEIGLIFNAAKKNNISVLFLMVKIESESSLMSNVNVPEELYEKRKNWCLGAAMYYTIKTNEGKIIKPWKGFENQINKGARCLRYWYDYYEPGKSVLINLNKVRIHPKNAATYALYKYTPFYSTFMENGALCDGNELVRILMNNYKLLWVKHIGKL